MKQKGGWLMPDFPVQMVTRVIRLGQIKRSTIRKFSI